MRINWWILVTAITLLAIAARLSFASGDALSPDQAYEEASGILQEDPTQITVWNLRLSYHFAVMARELGVTHAADILSLQLSTAEDSSAYSDVRVSATRGLRLQRSDSVEPRIQALLVDPVVRTAAAEVLASWGLWNDCVEILSDSEMYKVLVDCGYAHTDSLLQAALTTASPHGRLVAAQYLEDLGHQGILRTTALQILDSLLVEGMTYPDENNLNRALHTSLVTVAHEDGIVGRYQGGQRSVGFLNRSNKRIQFGPCRRVGGRVFLSS